MLSYSRTRGRKTQASRFKCWAEWTRKLHGVRCEDFVCNYVNMKVQQLWITIKYWPSYNSKGALVFCKQSKLGLNEASFPTKPKYTLIKALALYNPERIWIIDNEMSKWDNWSVNISCVLFWLAKIFSTYVFWLVK